MKRLFDFEWRRRAHPLLFTELTKWPIIQCDLSRAHTVRFLIVFCDCCLSHCTNMIPMSNCRISVVLMSDCTTVKTGVFFVRSFTSSIGDPRSLAIMVASKQQQRVALVLLITCLDNKKRRRHVWSMSWLGKRGLYGLPDLQRELEVILLFEFKHPISLQAASFLTLSW